MATKNNSKFNNVIYKLSRLIKGNIIVPSLMVQFIVIAFICGIFYLCNIGTNSDLANESIIIIGISFICLFITIIVFDFSSRTKLAIIIALYLRFFVLIIDFLFPSILSVLTKGSDEVVYISDALVFYNTGKLNFKFGGLYSAFIGLIFKVIGIQPLYIKFLNVCFSVLTIVYVVQTLKILKFSEKSQFIVSLVMAIMPYFIFYSTQILRESIIQFICSVSLYNFIKYQSEKSF